MLKILLSASVLLLLVGCASAPRPQMTVMPHKAPVIKAAPAPTTAPALATPNETVKKRWYSRFKIHPKWFH